MMESDRQPERRDSTSSSECSETSSSGSSSVSSGEENSTAVAQTTSSSATQKVVQGSTQATTTTTTTTTRTVGSAQTGMLGSAQQTTTILGGNTSAATLMVGGSAITTSDIISSRTVGQPVTTYGHSLYPNSYAAADQSGMQTREETRKVSSTIISEQFMNELPQENVKYIDVPVYQEVITHVTKKEIVEVEKRVPKYEYEYVEKIVEVPQIQIVDKHVEVPQIQEIIRHVPKIQIVERPKEVLRHIPKIETRLIEKTVEVPGPIVEVPKPYTVENPIPVTAFVDSDVPVVVAQSVHPCVTECDDVVEVDVTDYEPHVVPVDVHVVKPVSTAIHAGGHMERHRLVSVPHAQYNSLLKSLNAHLAINGKIDQELLPFVRDDAGQITFLNGEAQFAMLPEHAVVENMPRLRHKHREGRVVGHATASARVLNAQYDYSMPAVPVCQPRITRQAGAITPAVIPAQTETVYSNQIMESRKSSYTGVVPQQTYTTTTTAQLMPAPTPTMRPMTTTTVHRMPEPMTYSTMETKSQITTMPAMPAMPANISSSVIEAGRVTSQLPYSVVQQTEARPITVVREAAPVASAYLSHQSSELPPVYPAGESTYYTTQVVESYGAPAYSQAAAVMTREAVQEAYGSAHMVHQTQQNSYRSNGKQYLGSNAKTSTSVSSSDIMQVETNISGKGCCGCGGGKKEIYVVRQDSNRPSTYTHQSKSTHHSKSHKSDMISARSLVNEDAYVQGGSKAPQPQQQPKSETLKYEELSMPVTTATERDKSKKVCCC